MINLYFDIDGVLNTKEDWIRGNGIINPEAFNNFCELAKSINADLILLSSWRFGYTDSVEASTPQMTNFEEELRKKGLIIRGKVPDAKNKNRNELIEYYQKRHPSDYYIVLDDDESEYNNIKIKNNKRNIFYFINYKKGLTKEDIKEIIKITKEWNVGIS